MSDNLTPESMSAESARKIFREMRVRFMMNHGEFEPHTWEEAERLLELRDAKRRADSEASFDPGI